MSSIKGTPTLQLCYEKIAFYAHKLTWDRDRGLLTRVREDNLVYWECKLEKAIALWQKHHPREPLPQNPFAETAVPAVRREQEEDSRWYSTSLRPRNA